MELTEAPEALTKYTTEGTVVVDNLGTGVPHFMRQASYRKDIQKLSFLGSQCLKKKKKNHSNTLGSGHLKKVWENPSLRKQRKEEKRQKPSCNVNKDL